MIYLYYKVFLINIILSLILIYINYEKIIKNFNLNFIFNKDKFLIPIFIPDQESNAQMYIKHIALLAQQTNRTLVLPQLENGRMTLCGKYRFDHYYSLSIFEYYKNLKYIFYMDFNKLFNKYYTKELLILKDNENKRYFYENCVKDLYLKEKINNVTIHDINSKLEIKKNVDILMISYESHHKYYCYDKIICKINFDYNDKFKNIVKKFKNRFNSEYIALHWRMESTDKNIIIDCGKKMINTIKKYNQTNNILFLTDYPHKNIINNDNNELIGESKSFENINEKHHEIIKYIKNNLNFTLITNNYDLKNNNNYLYLDTTELDNSVLGIIDKLMAIESTIYLTGSQYCTGRRSSYISQIISKRNETNKPSYYWDN